MGTHCNYHHRAASYLHRRFDGLGASFSRRVASPGYTRDWNFAITSSKYMTRSGSKATVAAAAVSQSPERGREVEREKQTDKQTGRQRHTGRDAQAHRRTHSQSVLYQSALAECEFNEGRDIPVVKGQCLLQVGDSIPDLPCHQRKCEYE